MRRRTDSSEYLPLAVTTGQTPLGLSLSDHFDVERWCTTSTEDAECVTTAAATLPSQVSHESAAAVGAEHDQARVVLLGGLDDPFPGRRRLDCHALRLEPRLLCERCSVCGGLLARPPAPRRRSGRRSVARRRGRSRRLRAARRRGRGRRGRARAAGRPARSRAGRARSRRRRRGRPGPVGRGCHLSRRFRSRPASWPCVDGLVPAAAANTRLGSGRRGSGRGRGSAGGRRRARREPRRRARR